MENVGVAQVPDVSMQPETPRWSIERRKEALARAIASQLGQGGRRVESQSDFNAVIVQGKNVNHILHLILTCLTLGMWAVVWVLLIIVGGEKREMVTVDEYGNTSIQRL